MRVGIDGADDSQALGCRTSDLDYLRTANSATAKHGLLHSEGAHLFQDEASLGSVAPDDQAVHAARVDRLQLR